MNLPRMKCDKNCGDCCGPVVCTEHEFNVISEYILQKNITPKNKGFFTCAFYQNGQCAIYPVRPLLCKLFGHVKGMVCSRGYNVNISERQEKRKMEKYMAKKPKRLLNEILKKYASTKPSD